MRTIFDIQHTGRPSRPTDMGAAYDLDGDGVKGEDGEREVDLTRAYVAAAVAVLAEHGVPSDVLDAGEYGERHTRAAAIARSHGGPCLYLAAHINAGGGRYALVRPDYRSTAGADAAEALVDGLGELAEIHGTRTDALFPNAATAHQRGRDVSTAAKIAWWTRGWGCVDGIYAGPANLTGVLVEPAFIDSVAHRELLKPAGLARVGAAIARGALAYLRGAA